MEIEEIKAVWSEMSDQLEKQKKLTDEIIMEMTQERYRNKFRTISTYETIGAVVCFAAALLILVNFNKLDTWYLISCGFVSLLFLVLMPMLVLKSLGRIKGLDIGKNNYKETLVRYTKAKKNLLMLQQFGMYGSFIFMFTVTPVFSKILSNKDFFMVERGIWAYGFIAIMVVFLFFFARWGYG
ncbi:MAG: hypothetical protein WBG90_14375, partial [Saonia sp.]